MFSAFIGEVKGYFGKAFVPTVWMPMLTFVVAIATVYLAGQRSLVSSWNQLLGLKLELKIVLAIIFLISITVISLIVHYLQVPITRLFEGYWQNIPILNLLARKKRQHYQQKFIRALNTLDRLEEEIPQARDLVKSREEASQRRIQAQLGTSAQLEAEIDQKRALAQLNAKEIEFNLLIEKLSRRYPPPGQENHIMPTRLGNIYKSAELYPYEHYGIDPVLFWSRLLEIIPQASVDRLQEAKISVDLLLLISLLCSIFSVLTVPYLVLCRSSAALIVACSLGIVLSWLFYIAALAPAIAYSDLLKIAFDLYRRNLIKKFGLELPTSLVQEKKIWHDLSDFLFRGFTLPEKYSFESLKKED